MPLVARWRRCAWGGGVAGIGGAFVQQPGPHGSGCTTLPCSGRLNCAQGPSSACFARPARLPLNLCSQDAKRGFSAAAVFIARNRFATLDKGGNQLIIKDLGNEVGGSGCCLCLSVRGAKVLCAVGGLMR